MLENEMKTRLLQEMLLHVPFDGWQESTLNNAAKTLAISPVTVAMLFPGGVVDVIDFFADTADHAMEEAVASLPLGRMKVREKIAAALRLRLEQGKKHHNAIRRAMVIYAMPQHMARASRVMWRTADRIWYAIGDNATDHNYYTKRLTLMGVYSTTLLFWLDDMSENYEETWEFLDRRIENVMQFGRFSAKICDILGVKRINS